ncbi:alkylation response protein AidB-like acyl-CoA dehydrogenase [Erythromicrobium ramosum]|uniref:Alkylation response protein AidB-like acyl-CoA dehydrogenase n=1 Tax=Erythrobacter ramosus TaxID=35811 RepID=A0ABR6I222_9SPHN|nr:acyl-CoA dehydrogenase family protein [Erythrobacter ramosus]MBB3776971.1 alkylation response protein AidB-like acyl-CoA dehydrogenase [Erythrobacter ramosus]
MDFDLSDEQKMLAEQARGLLAERSPYDHLRSLIDSGAEWDEALWRELGEMGFLGASIPEEHGGLGLGELDLGVISHELGRANAAVPFTSSIVLAVDAIRLAGSKEQQREWLPLLSSGEVIGCFASAEGAGPLFGQATTLSDGKLNGTKVPVADAGIASIAVVQVDDGLALVRLDQPGVIRTKLASFDQLRAHYRIEFDNAEAEALPGCNVLATLVDRAAVQIAFEAVGGAEACLEMGRRYVMERQMFGRPLASYQAIKHKLADVAVAIELAKSNAYYAGWAAESSSDDLPVAAAAARLTAIKAFEMAARENLQVHGGIGYTFEANCHFYYRRERLLAVNMGSRGYWADRLLNAQPGKQGKAA